MQHEAALRVSFDPANDVASVYLTRRPIAHGEIVEDIEVPLGNRQASLYLGFASDGCLVQLEVLGASVLLRSDLLGAPELGQGDS